MNVLRNLVGLSEDDDELDKDDLESVLISPLSQSAKSLPGKKTVAPLGQRISKRVPVPRKVFSPTRDRPPTDALPNNQNGEARQLPVVNKRSPSPVEEPKPKVARFEMPVLEREDDDDMEENFDFAPQLDKIEGEGEEPEISQEEQIKLNPLQCDESMISTLDLKPELAKIRKQTLSMAERDMDFANLMALKESEDDSPLGLLHKHRRRASPPPAKQPHVFAKPTPRSIIIAPKPEISPPKSPTEPPKLKPFPPKMPILSSTHVTTLSSIIKPYRTPKMEPVDDVPSDVLLTVQTPQSKPMKPIKLSPNRPTILSKSSNGPKSVPSSSFARRAMTPKSTVAQDKSTITTPIQVATSTIVYKVEPKKPNELIKTYTVMPAENEDIKPSLETTLQKQSDSSTDLPKTGPSSSPSSSSSLSSSSSSTTSVQRVPARMVPKKIASPPTDELPTNSAIVQGEPYVPCSHCLTHVHVAHMVAHRKFCHYKRGHKRPKEANPSTCNGCHLSFSSQIELRRHWSRCSVSQRPVNAAVASLAAVKRPKPSPFQASELPMCDTEGVMRCAAPRCCGYLIPKLMPSSAFRTDNALKRLIGLTHILDNFGWACLDCNRYYRDVRSGDEELVRSVEIFQRNVANQARMMGRMPVLIQRRPNSSEFTIIRPDTSPKPSTSSPSTSASTTTTFVDLSESAAKASSFSELPKIAKIEKVETNKENSISSDKKPQSDDDDDENDDEEIDSEAEELAEIMEQISQRRQKAQQQHRAEAAAKALLKQVPGGSLSAPPSLQRNLRTIAKLPEERKPSEHPMPSTNAEPKKPEKTTPKGRTFKSASAKTSFKVPPKPATPPPQPTRVSQRILLKRARYSPVAAQN